MTKISTESPKLMRQPSDEANNAPSEQNNQHKLWNKENLINLAKDATLQIAMTSWGIVFIGSAYSAGKLATGDEQSAKNALSSMRFLPLLGTLSFGTHFLLKKYYP